MQHSQPMKTTLLLLATAWMVQGLGVADDAQAHGGQARTMSHRPATGSQQARATSHRPAPRPAAPRPALNPRRVLRPGFGSAANVRRGFYKQLDAPVTHHGGGVVPVPIYIYPQPVAYSQPAPVSPREIPAPAPQPIYIVTPPPAPAPAQTVPPAPAPIPAAVPTPAPKPRSTEPGDVQFSVQPADAKIYLDDDYLGTGAELAEFGDGQPFPPGVHVLEVTHPDYRPQRLVFGVTSKDATHVLVDLAVDRVGRRSRIK